MCGLVRHDHKAHRMGFNERSPPGDGLCPNMLDEIDGGKILKHPHRISGAESRHSAGEPDRRGAARTTLTMVAPKRTVARIGLPGTRNKMAALASIVPVT